VTTETETPEQITDAWREAIAARRIQVAEGQALPGAQVSRPTSDEVTRRNFIRLAFWSGLGLTLLGSVAATLDFLYPRGIKGFGSPVPSGNVSEYPSGGDPKHNIIGQFWLVNLNPGETRSGGSGGGEGMMALWHRCPHLGCTVPWRTGFTFDDNQGWFRCPCHGSTYTKAGVRVFGPAPRSMTTMQVDIDDTGNITVQTGALMSGSPTNPERAVSHPTLT
jgi:cytochrome b6-f complex iron-sulfur subunit